MMGKKAILITFLMVTLSLFTYSFFESKKFFGPIEMGGEKTPSGYFPLELYERTQGCNFFGNGFKKWPILDDFTDKWYSEYPIATGLKPIYDQKVSNDDYVIRFIWITSFDDSAVITVSRSGSKNRLNASRFSYQGLDDEKRAIDSIARDLSDIETDSLMSLFIKQKIKEQSFRDCNLGIDGAQWIVEIADKDGYYFVDRWSPDKGPIYDVGIAMLGLSGWTFKEIY